MKYLIILSIILSGINCCQNAENDNLEKKVIIHKRNKL